MMVTWQLVLSVCAGLVCIVTALEKIQDIIKRAKEPSKGVNEKLDNDNKRLNSLEETYDYLVKSNNLVIKTLFVILGELAINNDTDGKIKKAQDDINEFLINN